MPVYNHHPLYTAAKARWRLVRDCVSGEEAIKLGRTIYLPSTFADEDPARYNQYLLRARFMGVTGRTKDALLGMIFRKAPTIELPDRIAAMLENIDGSGQSLEQLAKAGCSDLLETGRIGVLVDYPDAPEGIDAETESRLGLRPIMSIYPTESIINWRWQIIGGRRVVTLVVLVESENVAADEFDHETRPIYRVLRLRDGVYTQSVYDEGGREQMAEYTPRMAGGATFDHIPFHFAGSSDNFAEPDVSILYDIATLDIGHYCNSADVEEAAFISGQPTAHLDIGDLDQNEWKSLNPNGVRVGSRAGVLTRKGKFELVQAQETSLSLTLMDRKESQMAMLGARLVQRGGQAETAEAARLNASAEASTLDNLVNNASEAFEAALEDMCLFTGDDPSAVQFRLNTQFWEAGVTAQDLAAIIAGVGTIYGPFDALEMIRAGRIYLRDDRNNEDVMADAAGSVIDSEEIQPEAGI